MGDINESKWRAFQQPLVDDLWWEKLDLVLKIY